MSILGLFQKRNSGAVARDRLQLILAHERSETGRPDLVIQLREEILAVIANHVQIDADKVKVTLERGEGVSTLGLDIELPLGSAAKFDGKLATKIAKVVDKKAGEKAVAEKRAA